MMSHAVQLSDATYQALKEIAEEHGQSPESIVESLIATARRNSPSYETEDWFRHLGVSEERIQRARERAERDADS